ncbi:hypothetical protein [Ferrovum myxofaciens]|uniref:hypothetical protein n=1 Tax=Ferrovum myxofaciens TaxID=416213 RepID=UPI002357EE2C|nr:hypothetical protein [Ferrovum myxofaciens]MBU6993496.1 hypothetical protein [Ferrovum myxofaciens]
MWKKIAKLLISMIWPEIKKFLAKYIKELLHWLEKKLKDVFTKRNDENAQEADSRAEQANHNAEQTADPVEAAKWKAVAAVWREVAEKFRKESEFLQGELNTIRTEAEAKTQASINALEFDDAFEVSSDDIRVIENRPLLVEKKP